MQISSINPGPEVKGRRTKKHRHRPLILLILLIDTKGLMFSNAFGTLEAIGKPFLRPLHGFLLPISL
jgi:hypothetical protein